MQIEAGELIQVGDLACSYIGKHFDRGAYSMMKNLFHGIASVLFVAWVVAVIAYEAFQGMHYLLLGSVIFAIMTVALYRCAATKRKP